MQLASITPPYKAFQSIWDSQEYHMVLPHWLKKYPEYREFYYKPQRDRYVILDNGEAEGVQQDWRYLQTMARRFKVQEMVLPDVMGNADKTRKAVEKATSAFEKPEGIRYMAVAHGRKVEEVLASARYYSEHPYIDVIGLPRILLERFGSNIRCWIASQIKTTPIHLLGMHWMFADELYVNEPWPDNVRSIDTSMHIVNGLKGDLIHTDTPIANPRDESFEMDWSISEEVNINVANYRASCT